MKTFGLYIATALAEIIGCYLPWLWLKQGHSAWLLAPAALSLAILWLWKVDGITPTRWDLLGAAVALAGMAVIVFQPEPGA